MCFFFLLKNTYFKIKKQNDQATNSIQSKVFM